MLKTVAVSNLKPNPFRRLEEYPIIREKIDALKESINSTGFWGTIVGRPHGSGQVEIAFGHHRLTALQELKRESVEIIVRDLSNEQMLKMMARENLEEWGSSAWVEMETVRATIEAYGKGKIELPKIGARGPRTETSQGSGKFYTRKSVAVFLGWTREHEGELQPNYACETAFKALEMIEKGFLSESYVRGLKRSHVGTIVEEQWSIFTKENRIAKDETIEAEQADKLAKEATEEPERIRQQKKAKVHRMQAEQHTQAASAKAKAFGKEAADMFRREEGIKTVRERAEELKPRIERQAKIHNMDEFLLRVARRLEAIANGDDELSKDFALAKQNISDATERSRNGLLDSFSSLIDRLERMRDAIDSTPRSHVDGTKGQHAKISEGNGRFKNR